MLEQNISHQRVEVKELLIGDINANESSKLVSDYLSKVRSLDVEQVKVYLGIAYFALVTLLSISLFF